MDIEIHKFDPLTAIQEEWKKYHVFRRLRFQETHPNDSVLSDELIELAYKQGDPSYHFFRFHVFEAGNNKMVIGEINLSYVKKDSSSYKGNEKILNTSINLLAPYRRKGLGKKLLHQVLEFAKEHKKSLVSGGTDEEDGKHFLQAMGAPTKLAMQEYRIHFDTVDWKMLEEWAQEGAKKSPQTKLEIHYSIPEDILEAYCKVYTETLNQMPFDDLERGDFIITPEIHKKREKDFKDLKVNWIHIIAKEPNGEISGFTNMYYAYEREDLIDHMFTGVQEKYRGRGLAKWLIAARFIMTKEKFPKAKVLRVTTFMSNTPIKSIAARLGYKLYKERKTTQLTLEKIEEYLAQN
ncbi:MAG: GNAT family N-acetyltransferase [Candidatus Hermodarchaeota archaeon]